MKNKSGITLIALIITIIVMLILVAVSVQILVKSDLIGTAEKTGEAYKAAHEQEENMEEVTIDGKTYANIEEYRKEQEGNGEGNPPAGGPEVDPPTEEAEPIPAGGTYTAANGTVYDAGENFPTLTTGDIYIYGDYEYRYNAYSTGSAWTEDSEQNGWGVRVRDYNKTEYGELLSTINGANVTNMSNTFYGCGALRNAPVIPENVTDMSYTFEGCWDLIGSTIIINANPTNYTRLIGAMCSSCANSTTITGSSEILDELAPSITGSGIHPSCAGGEGPI